MVSFILIRHGESKDNLRQVWAGWKDSPLSNHGMRQAEALGDDFAQKDISLSAIYTSDLLRAKTTAKAVRDRQANPNIPFHESCQLREQNFGVGEGMRMVKKEKNLSIRQHFAVGKFPVLHTRNGCFPGGESLDDMAQRADDVFDKLLSLHVLQENEDGQARVVAVFSHGLFIAELVAAIIRRDQGTVTVDVRNLRGMSNTAWTRLEVTAKEVEGGTNSQAPNAAPMGPVFVVRVTGVNRYPHLSNLHRQKGGIGSLAHDPAQQDIRSFLGGKQKPSTSTTKMKPY
ncbi:hypothetical protein GALMADRAFT_238451 [Galerina marginata CBS 339.88]|uniref:Phosphoglycerate mutase (2,3-diphosphoglycerate-dependent) n=1 Tax=Galerina marginata (strain CBS 339.88) TaxID=685588 RepID=A0A067TKI1_GALM3|nr:hypothetical protein GALMADRAFT_238451 [Galerina marginata CBS 339.88]